MKRMSKQLGTMLSATALLIGALSMLPIYPARAQDVLAQKAFEIPDSLGIRMLRIEKGTVTMGSPAAEAGRWDDEKQHTVTISRPFYMAETEITQEQYIPVIIPTYKPFFINAAAYGLSLPEVDRGGPFNTVSRNILDSAKHPMEGVIWGKAVEFCNKITEREKNAGRLPDGYIYRLPTEAEWEYACRAGSTALFNVEGAINTFSVAGPNLENTKLVKEGRKPNAWGLYDMHGNVYEWCMDWYSSYDDSQTLDPTGPANGEKKVARGGCYLSGKLDGRAPNPTIDQRCLRSAYRGKFLPDFPMPIIGFRIVLAPDLGKAK
ncbi:MAG: SUMF1/EgtB/PvdO family nonheme iron enzyme [Armatimonadetes bacterium]|nr:SUMF1/EgtB/PvdO family nonheme iron enzyme [Armatimonadota bacterium]